VCLVGEQAGDGTFHPSFQEWDHSIPVSRNRMAPLRFRTLGPLSLSYSNWDDCVPLIFMG